MSVGPSVQKDYANRFARLTGVALMLGMPFVAPNDIDIVAADLLNEMFYFLFCKSKRESIRGASTLLKDDKV